MSDIVSSERRSQMMSRIKSKDTKPELFVRKGLHKIGFRYRIHDRRLPGTPDLVFPKYRAVIFVHGCFWHGHSCHLYKLPATRTEFWLQKVNKNQELDKINIARLQQLNWRIALIWECGIKGKHKLSGEEIIELCAIWLNSEMQFLEIGGQC